MRILMTGITGFRNRGVEASVIPTVTALRGMSSAVEVAILTLDPDYDRLRLVELEVSAEVIPDRVSVVRTPLTRAREIASTFYSPILSGYRQAVEVARSASMVIVSGGDLFTSDYGPTSEAHLRPLQTALRARVPVVFLAQSIGPFKTRREIQTWLRVARQAALITTRESLSFRYVTGELGLPPSRVQLTADPAFLLPTVPAEVAGRLLRTYGVSDTKPIIAVAPSQGITRYAGRDYALHTQAWCDAIRLLRDELGAQVLLVPHVQERYPDNDDRVLATRLLRQLGFPKDVRIVGGEHSAAEFKGLLGACDMIVAERMHAAIGGLSNAVCTVTVGYSAKAEGIVTDLLPDWDPARRPLVTIGDFLDANIAPKVLLSAWQDRGAISHALRQSLPEVQRKAEQNFALIRERLFSN